MDAAVSDGMEKYNGKFLDNCKLHENLPWQARDQEFCRKHWDLTEEYVKLRPKEKISFKSLEVEKDKIY